MDIRIAKATEDDIPGIVALLREFAEFLVLGQFLEVTGERLFQAMFASGAFVEGLMAFDGERPVAYAIFYPCFASFRGQRSLFLEDIYIKPEYRRHNLGERMVREIARMARARGFERIDFHVLEDNHSAIRFYEKHGAVRDDAERHFKFVGEAFELLAKR
jgi:ribosomal protein S18 acetylase RimI-like enzyme